MYRCSTLPVVSIVSIYCVDRLRRNLLTQPLPIGERATCTVGRARKRRVFLFSAAEGLMSRPTGRCRAALSYLRHHHITSLSIMLEGSLEPSRPSSRGESVCSSLTVSTYTFEGRQPAAAARPHRTGRPKWHHGRDR